MLIAGIAAALALSAFATDGEAPPNAAAAAANAGWECAANPDQATELKCVVDWLARYSQPGEYPEGVTPAVYEQERARGRFLLARLGERVEASTLGARINPKAISREHYRSGLIALGNEDSEKALKEFQLALESDPSNEAAKDQLKLLAKAAAEKGDRAKK